MKFDDRQRLGICCEWLMRTLLLALDVRNVRCRCNRRIRGNEATPVVEEQGVGVGQGHEGLVHRQLYPGHEVSRWVSVVGSEGAGGANTT